MRNTIQAVGLDAAFIGASEIIADDEEWMIILAGSTHKPLWWPRTTLT
jgi:hypothetical protein